MAGLEGFELLEEQPQSPLGPGPEFEKLGTPQPERGPGTKAWERFWGTDVQDPLEFTRLGTIIAGTLGLGLGGAKLGAAVGAPGGPIGVGAGATIGAVGGGLAGAAGGAIAPEATMELAESLGIVQPGTRERVGLSDEDLRTIVEGELLLELTTMGGLGAARLGGRAWTRMWTAPGKAGRQLAEEASRFDIAMLPVQVGSRQIPRSFVAVMGRFPLISGPSTPFRSPLLAKAGQQSHSQLRKAFEEFPASIAPVAALDEVSMEVFRAARTTVDDALKQFSDQYADIYSRAERAGIVVSPSNTVARARELLTAIGKETPGAAPGKKAIPPTRAGGEVAQFIRQNFLPLSRQLPRGGEEFANQSLSQMDNLLTKIDERIGELIKEGSGASSLGVKRLIQLKQMVQLDMRANVRAGATGATAAASQTANDIAGELASLDVRYSQTMAELVETSVAKKFGQVRRGGLRNFTFDGATTQPIDALGEILLRGENPSTVADLQKLMDAGTFRRLTASVVDKRITAALDVTKEGATELNLGKLTKQFGLHDKKGKRYKHMAEMLERAGGASIKDIEKLAEIGQAIGSVEIPNVSTFIARRATMAGARGIITGMLPGLAIAGAAGGAGAYSQGSWTGGVMGVLAFVGGGRLTSRMLSNPHSARPLMRVLDKEASGVVKRNAGIHAMRMGLSALYDEGEITYNELQWGIDWGTQLMNALKEQIEGGR